MHPLSSPFPNHVFVSRTFRDLQEKQSSGSFGETEQEELSFSLQKARAEQRAGAGMRQVLWPCCESLVCLL